MVTGGDLELDKSFLSILAWYKTKGKESLMKVHQWKGKLQVHSVKLPGYSEDVKLLDPTHGEELLGVHIAMDGGDKDEHKKRITQVTTLAKQIRSSPLDRQDAAVIYRERWLNSVGYGLPVTQFDELQCEAIMKPFLCCHPAKDGI